MAVLTIHESEETVSSDGASRVPELRVTCIDSGLTVQQVCCGREHSIFCTSHGTVFTNGAGRYDILIVLDIICL